MVLVIANEKGVVIDVAKTNLKSAKDLGVISVGDCGKYLVSDKDAPKKGDKFNTKTALK